jgi:hypothetical protein
MLALPPEVSGGMNDRDIAEWTDAASAFKGGGTTNGTARFRTMGSNNSGRLESISRVSGDYFIAVDKAFDDSETDLFINDGGPRMNSRQCRRDRTRENDRRRI